MVVISLCRPLASQFVFWTDFLKIHKIDMTKSAVIIVGSKSDAVKPKKKLDILVEELEMLAKKHNLQPPIILSSHDLTNVSVLKKTISSKAKDILRSSIKEVPTSYLSLESLHVSKDLVVASTYSEPILSFFHNIGEIVFDKNSGRFFSLQSFFSTIVT